MTHIKSHQDIIKRRWPEIWPVLCEAPQAQSVELTTKTPESTLIIDHIHLTSAYDRSAEARLQISILPPESQHVHVYGFALGDIPRALLEHNHIQRLTVVILNPAATYQSLTHFDHRDWLDDSRITIELGSNQKDVVKPFLVAPALLRLCSPDSIRLRDQLLLRLAAPFQFQKLQSLTQKLAARVKTNQPFLENDGDVVSLFETHDKSKAIVVAGGPTLSDWFDWIREKSKDHILITVATSLVPLQRQGIDPDYVIVIEHRHTSRNHLDGADESRLKETPLIYAPIVDPEVLERWPGPRLAVTLQGHHYSTEREKLPRGELFCSGTVTHSAIDLAIRMGAQEVTLFGADFCYPRDETHVSGSAHATDTSQRKRSATWVVNGHGERVPTETNMLGYLRDLEDYIQNHPTVRFFKGGRDGSAIEGVGWID